jgi:hypothetical protein
MEVKKNSAVAATRRCWNQMIYRVRKPRAHQHLYAKIKVCDRWLHSFENFLQDMGERPSMEFSIDRYPDTRGDYKPENCRWATKSQQQRNTVRNLTDLYLFNGERKTLIDWSTSTKHYQQLYQRVIIHGWKIHDALLKPIRRKRINGTPK